MKEQQSQYQTKASITTGTPENDLLWAPQAENHWFRPQPLRTWGDDSGRYEINGRLYDVGNDKVRILKEDRQTITIPLSRLSQTDIDFVIEEKQRRIKETCSKLSKTKVPWTYEEQKDALQEFCGLYQKKPIEDNSGGMKSGHMFHVWFIAKYFNLPYIIESGIWYGQSTWLLEQACPNAELFCIDPVLEQRTYISKKAHYQTRDFNDTDWNDKLVPKDTLCFFDDHYGVDRIFQADAKGFKQMIYEDNYHDSRGNTFNPQGNCLSPKAVLQEFGGAQTSQPLLDKLQIYHECPPIYFNDSEVRSALWAEVTPEKYSAMTPKALEEDITKFPVFYNERSDYTWIAYIELKGKTE